jgi:hypothetical protein
MNEYASEVANSIKFFVGGERVDASSDALIDVISSSTEHDPTGHRIAGLAGQRAACPESRWMCWPASLGRGVLH